MKPISILLWLVCAAATADTGSFTDRCEKLATDAQIRVVFEDSNVIRDDSRSQDDLKRLSQSGPNPYHSVLGLTHAEPSASLDVTFHLLTNTDGKVCGVPSVALKLGFSTLQVFKARELKNSCRRNIVEAHEQEHVAVWRNHFRAGARLLTSLLQREFEQPTYFSNREEVEAALRRRVDNLIALQLKNLKNGIGSAHQQIDSPGSYRYEEGRMRACP